MELAVEIFGVVTGLFYLFFEIKHSRMMWFLGVFMAGAYIYLFAVEGLYASMSYQIYYMAVSIYGIVKWGRDSRKIVNKDDEKKIVVNHLSGKEALASIGVTIVVFIIIYFVLGLFIGDSQRFLDATVTVLSLLATYWLSRSFIQQWIVWIIVNVLSMVLYFKQGLYPTLFLYSLYTIFAFYGYYYWKKHLY